MRSKPTDFSRSAITAWSSAAAERGVSQRPKARKAPRSSGAPASGGSVPTSSGFLWSLAHTTTRWSRRLSIASARCSDALRSATLAAQQHVLLEGAGAFANQPDRREQRCADDADEHRELDDFERADHRRSRRRQPPVPRTAQGRRERPQTPRNQQRRCAAVGLRTARVTAMRTASPPPDTTSPADRGLSPGMSCSSPPPECKTAPLKAPRIRSDAQWTL